MKKAFVGALGCFFILALFGTTLQQKKPTERGKAELEKKVDEAIRKGVDYLLKEQKPDGSWAWAGCEPMEGATALTLYALIRSKDKIKDKGTLKEFDEVVRKGEKVLLNYKVRPVQGGGGDGHEQYGVALAIMALEALDAKKHKGKIKELVDHLLMRQTADGGWGYGPMPQGQPGSGTGVERGGRPYMAKPDVSMTQYILLALWFAQHGGVVKIERSVWNNALKWLLLAQYETGGWSCCTVGGGVSSGTGVQGNKPRDQGVNLNMTIAGIGSVLICKRNIGSDLGKKNGDVKPREVEEALKKATEIIEKHWKDEKQVDKNHGYLHFYYLYAIERGYALLEKDKIGKDDWYKIGAEEMVLNHQKPDGSFVHPSPDWQTFKGFTHPVLQTSWALLFLNRATQAMVETERGGGVVEQ